MVRSKRDVYWISKISTILPLSVSGAKAWTGNYAFGQRFDIAGPDDESDLLLTVSFFSGL